MPATVSLRMNSPLTRTEFESLRQTLVESGWNLAADATEEFSPRDGCDPRTLSTEVSLSSACWTIGWPADWTIDASAEWGSRLMLWPRGIPQGRRVAWISSRLGRAIDERADWFAVLKTAAARLDPQTDWLVTAPHTTTDRFLERAAALFGLPLFRIHLPEHSSLSDWLKQLHSMRWAIEPAEQLADVWISPPFRDTQFDDSQAERPLADRVLMTIADRIIAFQIRRDGNLHHLLKHRLRQTTHRPESVWLALGEALVPPVVAEELQGLGAVGWWLEPKRPDFVPVSRHEEVESRLRPEPSTNDSADEALWTLTDFNQRWGSEYFIHWTRRRHGPWPNQTETEFLDELLTSSDRESRSAFATLARIVRQRRLVGSADGIRGGFRVVSFSVTALPDVPHRRTFRGHRGRWDFECYGLCFRRDWLTSRGVQPVLYGDDALWESLAAEQRPLFQIQKTRTRDAAAVIDWTAEAEWRILQDVDFSSAPRDAVALFVPTLTEARQLSAISSWPVVVLSDDSEATRA